MTFRSFNLHLSQVSLSSFSGALAAVALAALSFATTPSLGATTTVSVLIDADNNPATGCSVATANGPFIGVDRVLNTTVVADATGYRTQSITLQSCVGSTLGAAQIIDSSALPIARGNGAGGTTAIETYVPNSFLPVAGQKMRVGIVTLGADGLTGRDALTLADTGPILVDGPPLLIVPTLTTASLALTALLLLGSLWFARRRGWHGTQLMVVMVFALSLSGQLIAAIVRDGLIADWTGIPPAATDPAGDAPPGADITNFYSTVENGNVFFRIDTQLNSPPVANAQTVTAVIGAPLSITLTGSDFEGSPLSFTVVTQPTQGVLSGSAPNLTYTPNAGAGVADSFTFKTNDGSADSAFAMVSIDIKRPPVITSANNGTFIPGQANSFTFTASGVPSANFALSACTPALPATITITNNGNNTGTLAGNPTVAQGGTYLCTLTASNGFGSNASQPLTLNLGLPPSFTSANSTAFTTGTAGTFAVTTTATPVTTSITQTGALPSGVTLSYVSGLNATLAGTPAAGTGGTYPITLTAGNGIPPNSTQSFSLTVNQAPAISSANSLTCIVGVPCSLPITATGFPAPTIAVSGAALPSGITYAAGPPGSGTLSGTPTLGGVGTYAISFTASSATAPNALQPFTLTVNKAGTTTALTSNTNPSIAGQAVTFTATVSPQGTGVPTGGVTFNDGATALCSNVAVNSSGVALCSTSALTVAASPHSVTAVYAGDSSFNTSTSVAVSQVVTKANASTALAASVNPSNFGQSVTFTATVSPVAPASGTPTGSVSFNDGAAALCSNVAVNGAGIATCTTATLSTTASPHSVTATYNGDASFNASAASTAISQVVNKAATTTALASGSNPSVSGQSVTFTATVSVNAPGAGSPTGTVSFSDGATVVCANVAVSGAGVATCATSTLAAGPAHSMTASYSGDASFSVSTSSPLAQTVTKANTTTALTSGTNPSAFGQSVTFTAAITAVAPGVGTLTGTVAFNDGATVVCAAAVVSAGAATCTSAALSATGSPHSMTATYSGDANFNSSVSAAVSQIINKANTTSTVSSSKTPTVAGESVTFTAAVAPVAPGAGVPSGTVTFNDGATAIAGCSAVAMSGGSATCATTALTVAAHSITVTYSGDAAFNASASAAITQGVGLAGTTTALTTSGSPSIAGSSVSFTAAVAPVAPATGTPNGTVTFNDGATPICANVALVAGSAVCSTTALGVGSHSITALYSGSAAFASSSSAALTQAVNPGPATHFGVSAPAAAVSGTPISITVTALDALNNVATGYLGTAHFTSTDAAATLPADYVFTAGDSGSKVFPATLLSAGIQTVTATDTVTATITGVSGSIAVGAGGATHFAITAAPASSTAGVAFTYTVTALDAANNTATGYVGTVRFTSNDPAAVLPANYTFLAGDNGVKAGMSATLKTAGARSITATDTVTAAITGARSVTVTSAAASTYSITAPAAATSGTAFNITVTALDGFGNTATAYAGTAHLTSSDGSAVLPADFTLTAGVATRAVTLRTAGSQTITATDTVAAAITGTSTTSVSPGTATQFSVVAPAGATSTISFNFTVTARDAANNIATGYVGTARFTSTDGTATLPANYTFTGGDAGVRTFASTLVASGAQTITATDTVTASITGTSNSITVSAGSVITSVGPATFVAGTNSSYSITTSGIPAATSITLTGCTLPTGLGFSYVSGSSATISGNASVGGSVTCTVTATNGVGAPATQSLVVTANKAPTIAVATNPAFTIGVAGSAITFTVTGFPAPTLALSGCVLPSALSLTSGQISGTASVGAATVTGCIVTASNGIGAPAATPAFTVTVNSSPAFTSANSATFTVGTLGSFTATANGAPAPTITSTCAGLPSGVTAAAATLSGTPAAATGGSYPAVCSFTAANGVLPNATQSFTLTVNQAVAITSPASAALPLNQAGSFTITTSGFPVATNITLTGCTLPTGLTFSYVSGSTATISGTPTTSAPATCVVTAANGVGPDAMQTLTIVAATAPVAVNDSLQTLQNTTLSTSIIGNDTPGVPTPTITFGGGSLTGDAGTNVAGTIVSLAGGNFTINTSGLLTLTTPPTIGTYTVNYRLTNVSGSSDGTITIIVGTAATLTGSLPGTATVGTPYTATLTSGGSPTPTTSLQGGSALPAGLSLTGNTVSGTPTSNAPGPFTGGLVATNTFGTSTPAVSYSISVSCPALTVAPPTVANPALNTAYTPTVTFSATGLAGAFTWAATGVPSGMAVSTAGVFSGTPTVSGAQSMTVTGTHSSGCQATRTYTFTITVPPPVVTTSVGTTTFTEGGPAVIVDSGVTPSSAGFATLASATVSITGGFQSGQDVLGFVAVPATMGNILGSYAAPTLSLASAGATATIAQWQAALRAVTYSNTSQNPNTANRTLSFVVNDSVSNSAAATKTVAVIAVNNPPILANASIITYVENDAATVINTGITVTDADTATLTGATVSITTNFNSSQDLLSYATALGITGTYTPASGVLALTGTTTLANYQTALRNVKYSNSSNNPTLGARTVTFVVSDGTDSSNTISSTINITPVNDAPTAVAKNYSAQANMKLSIAAANGLLVGATDPDGAAASLTVGSVSATTPVGGSLTVNTTTGAFDFDPPPGATGNVSFTYTVCDNGVPAPVQCSAAATATINVGGPVIWFVNSAAAAGGTGTLSSPFNTLAAAVAVDAAFHGIFLYSGTYSTGITLNASELLIGQGATGASFDALFGITPPAGTIARPTIAGTRPIVQGAVALNTNSTVRGINITTGAATGMTGGAVTGITVADTIVSTTTATAVNFSGTSGNASFTSISTNGANIGIALLNTSGSFTVTGDGSGLVNGTGGTLANAGAGGGATSAAINATTTAGTITLKSMNISLNTSANHGVLIDNNLGGTLGVNVSGVSFTGVTASVAQNKSLLQIETGASANVTSNVQNSFFNGSRTYGFAVIAVGTSVANVTLNQSGFGTDVNTGAAVNTPGTTISNPPAIGMLVSNSASALVNYSVTNNTFWGASGLAGALYAVTISGASTVAGSNLSGSFTGNKIGKAGVTGSGCSNNCAGLGLLPGVSGTFDATVSNNDIRQVNAMGINFVNLVPAANGASKGRFTNNTITEPDTTGTPAFQRGLIVTSGNSGGAAANWCAQVTGNTVSGAWQVGSFIRISSLNTTGTLTIPGLTPLAGASGAQIDTYIEGANAIGAGNSNATVGGPIVGGASCP